MRRKTPALLSQPYAAIPVSFSFPPFLSTASPSVAVLSCVKLPSLFIANLLNPYVESFRVARHLYCVRPRCPLPNLYWQVPCLVHNSVGFQTCPGPWTDRHWKDTKASEWQHFKGICLFLISRLIPSPLSSSFLSSQPTAPSLNRPFDWCIPNSPQATFPLVLPTFPARPTNIHCAVLPTYLRRDTEQTTVNNHPGLALLPTCLPTCLPRYTTY
ncbi:hypothetical protein LY76DRAFT_217550 [Colletotrichum caudatum]|nr:hypothetical protein LY76DRAFT_217550 [Colletotrichum caudatum]